MNRKSFFKTLGLSVITSFLPISLLGYNRNNNIITYSFSYLSGDYVKLREAYCYVINGIDYTRLFSEIKISNKKFDLVTEYNYTYKNTITKQGGKVNLIRAYIKQDEKITEFKNYHYTFDNLNRVKSLELEIAD